MTAGDQNGLAGLLRIYTLLMKVPLSDLVDLRIAIESMTAAAAAERRAGERLAELAAAMADVEDRDRFLELDTGFHVELARASGNALAPLLMEALRETIAEQDAGRVPRGPRLGRHPRADRGRPPGARRGDRRR